MDRTNGGKLCLNTMFSSQQIQSSGQLTLYILNLKELDVGEFPY